jgi:hypothetical protein
MQMGSEMNAVQSARRDFRAATRYALQVKVVFTWRDPAGSSREGRGETRDISQKGAFVIARDCPREGTAIAMNIYLPPLVGEKAPLRIATQGRVLRVEICGAATGESGFAVASERVILCAA